MGSDYFDIAFTPSVRSLQSRMGSRAAYADADRSAPRRPASLTVREARFIAQRDGFFQATVSETGWPYVQFRGGPPGFLKLLDTSTLGYADFRGNTQYLSDGNLLADDRISMILIDQAQPRRLKLFGRVRLIESDQDPELIARLSMPGYPATVERAVLIDVQAFDWNCPQHITPRFTAAEWAQHQRGSIE